MLDQETKRRIDSLRDKIDLDKLCNENKAFWKK